VNGVAATSNQIHDPVQTPTAARYSQSYAGFETEMDKAHDVGKIEATKPIVIGNI
jgi:hypothetical protein